MSKRLILERHGEPLLTGTPMEMLTLAGRQQADSTAAQMDAAQVIPEAIIHSPHPRTTETALRTAEFFQNKYGVTIPVTPLPALQDPEFDQDEAASLADIADHISQHYPGVQTVLAISHESRIARLTACFTRNAAVYPGYAEAVVIEAGRNWTDMAPDSPLTRFKPGL